MRSGEKISREQQKALSAAEEEAAIASAIAETVVTQKVFDAGSVFTGAAGAVAAAIACLFLDVYVLRSPVQLGALLGLSAATFSFLLGAYSASAKSALQRKASHEYAKWYSVFQVNFWFFAVFGFLAAILMPLVEAPLIAALGESLGGRQSYGIIQAGVGCLAGPLVWGSGRTRFY